MLLYEMNMKTLTIDEIKGILQNRTKEQLDCLSVILIPYINNKLFNENASLIRNLSGLSLRQTANELGISGQALSQFEKRKEFPADKTKKLFQLYLKIAVDYAFNGNKRPLNTFFSLFFFKNQYTPLSLLYQYPILSSETIAVKEESFKEFINNLNNDIYQEELSNKYQLDLKKFAGKDNVYYDFYNNIDIETKPVLTALTSNLKNIRFLLDKDQYEMSKLLGISNKTYSFYENNLNDYVLNAYDACNIIIELFNSIETKKTNNENLKKIIKLLLVQENNNDNTIVSEAIYDYCIAIKYKQSQRAIADFEKILVDYVEDNLAEIEVKKEFNI